MNAVWQAGILRGRAQLRHMLAVQAMKNSPTAVSDEVLKHFREEKKLLRAVVIMQNAAATEFAAAIRAEASQEKKDE